MPYHQNAGQYKDICGQP